MFVHIGYETSVRSSAILAILTKESAEMSAETKALLMRLKAAGAYKESSEAVRSYVFFSEAGRLSAAESALRTKTLYERVFANSQI